MPNVKKLEVRSSEIDGMGVFAKAPLAAGVEIGTYRGRRAARNGKYVLWVTDEAGVEYGISGKNKLRYLNHSKAPTVEFDGEVLYALTDLAPGDELTFYYGDEFEASLLDA